MIYGLSLWTNALRALTIGALPTPRQFQNRILIPNTRTTIDIIRFCNYYSTKIEKYDDEAVIIDNWVKSSKLYSTKLVLPLCMRNNINNSISCLNFKNYYLYPKQSWIWPSIDFDHPSLSQDLKLMKPYANGNPTLFWGFYFYFFISIFSLIFVKIYTIKNKIYTIKNKMLRLCHIMNPLTKT